MKKLIPVLWLLVLFAEPGSAEKTAATGTHGPQEKSAAPAPQRPQMSDREIEECKKQFGAWRDKYLGGTPYAASNKANSLVAFDEATLDKFLKGTKTIQFLDDDNKTTVRDIAKEAETMRKFAATPMPGSAPDRFDLNTAYVAHLVRNNPPDNLLIVFSGAKHARDFYFSDPKAPVAYAEKTTNKDTIYFSPEFYDFMNQVINDLYAKGVPKSLVDTIATGLVHEYRNVFPIQTQRGQPLKPLLASQFAMDRYVEALADLYASEANRGRLTAKDLLKGPAEKPTAIFLGDVHPMNGLDPITKMPSASCLKVMGFNSVSVAFEPFTYRKEPRTLAETVPFVNYASQIAKAGEIAVDPTKPPLTLGDFVKRFSPKADAMLKSNMVQVSPGDIWMVSKAYELEKSGMKVKVQGLEFEPEAPANQEWLKLLRAWNKERKATSPNPEKLKQLEEQMTKLGTF